MANGKREFEIKINGISQSIEIVTKLVDTLGGITDKTVKINAEMEKANKVSKERKQALTEEEKAQKKLEETLKKTLAVESETNKAQIEATARLRERTREVTRQVQMDNLAEGSVRKMGMQLTDLRNEYESLSAEQRNNEEVGGKLLAQIQQLDAEYKSIRESTGNFRDSVGNYEKALKGLGSTIDTTSKLGLGLTQTFMGGFQVLSLFGGQTEENTKQMQTLQKILALLSIAQGLNNNLIKSGTLLKIKDVVAEKARAAATAASTVVTNASSVAVKLFSKALVATGIGAIVVGLGMLIANFDKVKKIVLDNIPGLNSMGEAFDEVKAIVMGVGEAVINFVLAPIKTLVAVVQKLIEGDFKGAIAAGKEEMKKGLDIIGNYQKGYEEQTIANAQNAAKERAKTRAAELDNLIKDNEAKAGSDWKYTEEGKKAYADLFAAKRVMYAGDIEAMRELQREEWKHLADIQKQADDEVKRRREAGQRIADARKQALESYKKALESFQSETHSLELANEQKRIDLAKDTAEKLIATTKDELALRNLAIEDSYEKQNALNKKLAEDEIKAVEKNYGELIASAKKAGQDTITLETEKQERLKQLRESAAITELNLNKEKSEKLKTSNDKFKEDEEKRQKDLLDIQKRWADLSLKEADNQFRSIQDAREKLVVREKNGMQLIDIDATRKNLEETDRALNEYIGKLQTAKEKLKTVHEENLKGLKEGTPEYEEELNRYADAEYSLNKKLENANKEKADNAKQAANLIYEYWQDMFSKISEIASGAMEGVTAIFDAINSVYQSQLDELNAKYDEVAERYDEVEKRQQESADKIKSYEDKIKEARSGTSLALREQLAFEMQAKAELDQQERKLAKEKEKREADIAKKEKQMKKAQLMQDIAGGTANIALGITKAWSLGPILGPIMAILVAAAGAVQIGVMARQLAKMEDGGLLNGPSHANGGMRIQGTNIEVEGGEYVINKRSTANNQRLIEFINNSNGTVTARDIANLQGIPTGNYVSPPDVQIRDVNSDLLNSELLDAIRQIKPVVAVKDINDVNNSMVEVKDIAGMG